MVAENEGDDALGRLALNDVEDLDQFGVYLGELGDHLRGGGTVGVADVVDAEEVGY